MYLRSMSGNILVAKPISSPAPTASFSTRKACAVRYVLLSICYLSFFALSSLFRSFVPPFLSHPDAHDFTPRRSCPEDARNSCGPRKLRPLPSRRAVFISRNLWEAGGGKCDLLPANTGQETWRYAGKWQHGHRQILCIVYKHVLLVCLRLSFVPIKARARTSPDKFP